MSEEPPQVEERLPPYVIEAARSGRARCKTCRRAIAKGALRIGVLIEGPYGTGYLWHHLPCAARRQPDRVEEAYELEAWKEAKTPPPRVPPLDELRKLRDEAEKKRQSRREIPYVELAPSGRSRCKRCGDPIEQGAPRVVLGRGVQFGNQVRTAPVNVHPRCVVAELSSEECNTDPADLGANLRANSSGMTGDQVEALLREIGPLDGIPPREEVGGEGS